MRGKEISKKRLFEMCLEIDEQTIIDACKWININGIPSNRKTEKISFIVFNNKTYPIRYVLEIANNEIKKNQIKLGPQNDYNVKWFEAEQVMLILFSNSQKFKIATPNNENGKIILEKYRKQILSYARSYGSEIKNMSKKWKKIHKNAMDCKIIETRTEKYTTIKLGKFTAEVSSVDDHGNGEYSFIFNDIYIQSEKDINQVLEIISNAANNI